MTYRARQLEPQTGRPHRDERPPAGPLTYRGTILNITCELLNLYLDDGTAIAEWEATFDDTAQQVRKRMREVALLTFDGPLIDGLREYWASEELPATALAHQQRNPNGG